MIRKRTSSFKPRLEVLEDRLCPSGYSVIDLGTPGTGQAIEPKAILSGPSPVPAVGQAPGFVRGELLVKFRDGTSAAAMGHAAENVGAEYLQSFRDFRVHHWGLPAGLAVADAIGMLEQDPNVEYAEPNYIIHADSHPPNDPQFANLWGLNNTGQSGGTPGADIDALAAWHNGVTGNGTAVVAVVDSGVSYNHTDLAGNIWANPGEIAGNGIDDDANGYIDDVRGWDFVNKDNDPNDDYGHGTHVAGTIGALGNNGVGVTGVAWDVQIMPLKFLNSQGSGSTADAISAILYAASFKDANGNPLVRVHNYSWGGGGFSEALRSAIATSGAVVAAAAGNNNSSEVHYPAAYDLDNVIAVAATDRNDQKASFSNFGSWVELAAPGVDILSTNGKNKYVYKSGTSMAAPHVAGAAALILMSHPTNTNGQIRDRILLGVDPLASLAGITVTGGRLNLYNSLTMADPALPPADVTVPAAVTDLTVATGGARATLLDLRWTATGDDGLTGTASTYDIRYSTVPITEANWANATQATLEPVPNPAGSAQSFYLMGLASGTTHYVAMKVIDEAGNASALSNVVSATTLATDVMSVSAVYVNFSFTGGPKRQPSAYVYVADSAGYPVVGVTVTGQWSGLLTGTGSGVTVLSGTSSYAKITHPRSASCWGVGGGGDFVFTVTNVFDPAGIFTWDGIQVTGWTPCF